MSKKLRALILAAGHGSRLRPLTLKTPKCLVEVGGQPLLYNWLKKLEQINCERTLINTHHLPDKVDSFIKDYSRGSMKVESIFEPDLLGTFGTLYANRSWFKDRIGMLIHGDNFTKTNLIEFLDAHNSRPKECLLTMMTFKTSTPKSCGIVETDKNDVMIDFHEKINYPPSNHANGAVYLFDNNFIDWIEGKQFNGNDFSLDVLPLLKNKVKIWRTNEYFIDIGTPEALNYARSLCKIKNS